MNVIHRNGAPPDWIPAAFSAVGWLVPWRQGVVVGAFAKVALVSFAFVQSLTNARAEPLTGATEIEGQVDALQLRATNASLRQVLEALSSKFNVSLKLPPNVVRELTGVYSGTLLQIVARVLDGENYIVSVSDGAVDIVLLAPAAGASPTAVSVVRADVAASGSPAAISAQTPSPAAALPARPARPAPDASLPQGKVIPPLSTYLSGTGETP